MLLTGASGAGKSSVLKALTGTLREFQGGDVRGTVDAFDEAGKDAKIGFVPQDARDAFLAHDPLTEFQLRLQAHGWKYHGARDEALRLLTKIQLDVRARVPVYRLSAGERRRLALFASRVHGPTILLLDEPLNHLDAAWRNIVINDISGFAEKALVVVATHEPEPWQPIATRELHVTEGEVHATKTRTERSTPGWRTPRAPAAARRLVAAGLADARSLIEGGALQLGNGLHAIAGPNGSGKSTLLRILGGLEESRTGNVTFDGVSIGGQSPPALARFRAHHIEEPREIFFMERSRDEIRFQPTNAGFSNEETERRTAAAATEFGIEPLLDRHPLSLSGGEQERMALACTSAARADLLLLDEPTHGLDDRGRADLLCFLRTSADRACVVLATHDESLIDGCDTVHRIENGRLRLERDQPSQHVVEVRPRAP